MQREQQPKEAAENLNTIVPLLTFRFSTMQNRGMQKTFVHKKNEYKYMLMFSQVEYKNVPTCRSHTSYFAFKGRSEVLINLEEKKEKIKWILCSHLFLLDLPLCLFLPWCNNNNNRSSSSVRIALLLLFFLKKKKKIPHLSGFRN